MDSTRPTSSASGNQSEGTSNVFQYESSGSEADQDNYDTDDSETYGFQTTDCYPIRGVHFYTSDIYSVGNPGAVYSSPIDQWITFIILHFNQRRVKNFKLMIHEDEPGKELEKVIKNIAVTAEYNRRIFPRPSDDNKLKVMWLDYSRTGEATDNGLRIMVGKEERLHVHHHLQPISTINETVTCRCPKPRDTHKKVHHFIRIRNLRDLEKASSGQIPITSLGGLRNCRKCCAAFFSYKVRVPLKTWLLTFEVDENTNVKYNDFQRRIRFDNEDWVLAYITFRGPPFENYDQMYFSLQFIGNRSFMYHGGRTRNMVTTFTDPRLLINATMERAVYIKDIEIIIHNE